MFAPVPCPAVPSSAFVCLDSGQERRNLMAGLRIPQFLVLLSVGLWVSFGASGAFGGTQSDLSLTVKAATVASKFLAYVGGGANIEPPEPIGGGGGLPVISLGRGSTWLAGEVSSND